MSEKNLGITEALMRNGFWQTYYYHAGGQLAGTGVFDPSRHGQIPGRPFDDKNYRLRYGIPLDSELYHPVIAAESREVLFPRAVMEAAENGYFQGRLGGFQPPGTSFSVTDEELSDLLFLAPALAKDIMARYGPSSRPAEKPTEPATKSLEGQIQGLKHPLRSKLWLWPMVGVAGWPELIEELLPEAERTLANPEYDQQDANKGEEVVVPLSLFVPMFKAWRESVKKPAED